MCTELPRATSLFLMKTTFSARFSQAFTGVKSPFSYSYTYTLARNTEKRDKDDRTETITSLILASVSRGERVYVVMKVTSRRLKCMN